jgi:hypothetical protein
MINKCSFFLIDLLLIIFTTSKYIIKRKPKTLQPFEFGVPQAPELAYDVYPGIEWHTLDQKYIEMIPGEDLAQIETNVGMALPMNLKLVSQANSQISLNVNKLKNR